MKALSVISETDCVVKRSPTLSRFNNNYNADVSILYSEWCRRRNCTFMCHKFLVLTVKKWLKSVYISRSYRKIKTGYRFFGASAYSREFASNNNCRQSIGNSNVCWR